MVLDRNFSSGILERPLANWNQLTGMKFWWWRRASPLNKDGGKKERDEERGKWRGNPTGLRGASPRCTCSIQCYAAHMQYHFPELLYLSLYLYVSFEERRRTNRAVEGYSTGGKILNGERRYRTPMPPSFPIFS